jgi:hypothetical protein
MAETKKNETREQIILDALKELWVDYWGNLPHRVSFQIIPRSN